MRAIWPGIGNKTQMRGKMSRESMLCRFCLTFWGNSTVLMVRINNYALDVIWGVQKTQNPPSLCLTDDFCNTCMRMCMLRCFSRVWPFATLWTTARQAPSSMGFFRQEYWSGLPCPPPGDCPNPGIESMSLVSPALASGFFTTEPPGKPLCSTWYSPN